jgi:hypothetical protein
LLSSSSNGFEGFVVMRGEKYQRSWASNAGIGEGKRFQSINLTFYEISEKGVRCDSKIIRFDFEIVLYETEIVPVDFKIVRYDVETVHYDPENTVIVISNSSHFLENQLQCLQGSLFF